MKNDWNTPEEDTSSGGGHFLQRRTCDECRETNDEFSKGVMNLKYLLGFQFINCQCFFDTINFLNSLLCIVGP